MPSDDTFEQKWQRIDRRRAGRTVLGIPLRFALFLFLPAGTIAWMRGWLFVLISLAATAAALGCLWRLNPEVVIARSHYHAETKRWDKILLCCFYLPAMLSILLVAGLDDGHFHWFPVPWWVCALGYVLLLLGFGLFTWAEAVNKFFEQTVRIQSERGQRVIDSGPYAIVRHPGYMAAVLIAFGTALSLGSLWALIPAAISSLLLILRTKWEDQTLQQELAGYKEYTEQVRYRLIPSAW
jgi:protein-S-isoprenylcysteine O-methyltransferase Ste14